MRVIERARENVEDPALPAIRAAFDLSADEAVALLNAVDRWLEEKWPDLSRPPAWLTRDERAAGRNLHG